MKQPKKWKLLTLAFVLMASCATETFSQTAKIWEDYLLAKKNGTEAILPDFSYAGYKFSELAIPKAKGRKFKVTDYGAKANDGKSDKEAIKKTIAAASAHGGGIVFFPKGRYIINGAEDDNSVIEISQSNIVLQGEQNTHIFFDRDLPAKDPNKLWTTPYAIATRVKKSNKVLAEVSGESKRETYSLRVKDASKLKKDQWVVLTMQNNDNDLVREELAPLKLRNTWTSIAEKGVLVKEIHKIKSINKQMVHFYDPIHYTINPKHGWTLRQYNHLENIGIENIRFEGNWKQTFIHHKDAQHDGGWSVLELNSVVDSWIRNCTFTDVNRAVTFNNSVATTGINNVIDGHQGHSGFSIHGSTGILIAKLEDKAGMWHAAGVGGGGCMANVIWRSSHTPDTSFESHASQPRCTLFDQVKGGFFLGRGGGAKFNLPNHLRYLVLWNYEETDKAEKEFEFQSSKTWFWQIVPPIVVGFHGAGTTFKAKQVQYEESTGRAVAPESLFEAQLKLRLGKLPRWIKKEKKK